MANELHFHFTIDPVQSFIAQARRTRDLWAGSFLLSWLSGVAIAITQTMGGRIEFPIPDAAYLGRICGRGEQSFNPRVGAIPNRFTAIVPSDFDGKALADAVQQSWMALADCVWQRDLASWLTDDAERQRVAAIWQRQHMHFWEITWVLTEQEAAFDLLDRRKNWRSHLPPDEPGVKCMIMDGLQELSGIAGMDKASSELRRDFWRRLREKNIGANDFADGEMLCALALLKRRFARHFSEFKTTLTLSANKSLLLRGWKLDSNMPSVAYMAAVHWLEALVKHATLGELQELYAAAVATGCQHDEWRTEICCLEEALRTKADAKAIRRLLALDGNLFFDHALEQPLRYGFDETATAELKGFLHQLRKNHADFARMPLSPFYAVLLMDGDNLGAQLSIKGHQRKIAEALQDFTGAAAKIVYENSGLLIYAGGDDVLALLPLENALQCAKQLRAKYQACFEHVAVSGSLSGAVIYTHVKVALGEALCQAHQVLKKNAKQAAGRDAIAVRVLKPGGEKLTWAQPWRIAIQDGQLVLDDIATAFRQAASGEEAWVFSSKFFYRMRERFAVLSGLEPTAASNVLAADYLASLQGRASGLHMTLPEARQVIEPLLNQCRMAERQADQPDWQQWPRLPPSADAALLVRFLAQKGV